MIRKWRHLKLLKRGGRAHVHGGVKETSSGELALLCPACPRSFYNLPDNWAKAPKESAYVKEAICPHGSLTVLFQVLVLSIIRY